MPIRANRSPFLPAVVACGFLALLAGGVHGAEAPPPAFKTVPFDQAMKRQIARSLPLRLTFPADYDMAVDPAISGALWARPADLEIMLRTREAPPAAGFFRGRLVVDVRYDPGSGLFACGPGCGEAEMKADIERFSGPLVAWRTHPGGVPVLLVEGHVGDPSGAGPGKHDLGKYYLAYIATMVGGGVMLVSYLPPADSPDGGAAVWRAFSTTLLETAAVAQVAAAPLPTLLDFFEMAARGNTFRQTVNVFVAAARGGDVSTALELISPAVVERLGRRPVETYLSTKILPFFAQFAEFGGSTTIAPFADERGSRGFVFHLTMAAKAGGERPFSIFVVEEDARQVVSDIVVDRDLAAGGN